MDVKLYLNITYLICQPFYIHHTKTNFISILQIHGKLNTRAVFGNKHVRFLRILKFKLTFKVKVKIDVNFKESKLDFVLWS